MVKRVFLRHPQENTLLVFFENAITLYLSRNLLNLESLLFFERLYDESNYST